MRKVVLAAIFGLVLAGGLSGYSPPDTKLQAHHKNTEVNKIGAPPLTVAQKAPSPDPLTEGCDKGEDRRTSDLCAQWKAADGAYESAVWTRRTGILTAIGLVVGSITMAAAIAAALFAKEAAGEAKRAANSSDYMAREASVANAVALSTFQSNRAWLLPNGVEYGVNENGFLDGHQVLKGSLFSPKILNSGGSPAINVGVSRDFCVEYYKGDTTVPNESIFTRREVKGDGIVEINAYVPISIVALNDYESSEFRARKVVIFLNVQISYSDIHGIDHETAFTYVALHNGGHQSDGSGNTSESVSFVLYSQGQKVT